MMRRVPGTLPTVIVSAAVGIVAAAAAAGLAGPWNGGQRVAEQRATPRSFPPVVADRESAFPPTPRHLPAVAALLPVFAGDSGVGVLTSAGLQGVLDPLAGLPGLGKNVGIAVADPASPILLYDKSAETAFAPASTNKLVTSVAALAALGPDRQIATRVIGPAASQVGAGGPAQITLVGGGDPSLTGAVLDSLAAQAARALQKTGVKSVTLGYDTSLFAGPALNPTWSVGYTDGNVAPVTSLMVDEGRSRPADDLSPRVADPAGQAAAAFATDLAAHGVQVAGKPVAAAPAGAGTGTANQIGGAVDLARVLSPRLGDLVEHMLTVSDNDYAEALLRQVAIADDKPASFAGGVAAVRDVLSAKAVGLDLTGLNVVDGSGLSRQDRITPATLVRVLSLAAATAHPDLRATLTGLPVAGFTGTLAENNRFGVPLSSSAAGLVRAKTGSLAGVATLAGIVRDNDGRLLVFAFMADQAPDAVAARAALDRLAAGVTACGCA